MATLVQQYKNALESIHIVENEDGILKFIYLDENDEPKSFPVAVVDKPLVLPHKENLHADKLKDVVIFHPLSESVIRGESEVLQKFRLMLTLRFKTVITDLMSWMVTKAIDPKAAKKFSPKQKAFFDILADATPNTKTALDKLIHQIIGSDAQDTLVNIYLRRTGATFEGQKVTRAAIVSFPFMEGKEVVDKKHRWCGIEMSQKDIRMLTGLFEYLVPGMSDPGEIYNAGSNDTQAPYFDCLIHCFAKLVENVNNIILLLGDKYDHGKYMYTDTSWVPEFEPLSQYRGQIPSLPYNDGQLLNKLPEPTQATKATPAENPHNLSKQQASLPTETGPTDPLSRLLSSVKEKEAPKKWGDDVPAATQAAAPVGGGTFNSLMANVYKKNGMEIPQGGFGSVQSAWTAPAQPQSPSALRRRKASDDAAVTQTWTGMRSSNW